MELEYIEIKPFLELMLYKEESRRCDFIELRNKVIEASRSSLLFKNALAEQIAKLISYKNTKKLYHLEGLLESRNEQRKQAY